MSNTPDLPREAAHCSYAVWSRELNVLLRKEYGTVDSKTARFANANPERYDNTTYWLPVTMYKDAAHGWIDLNSFGGIRLRRSSVDGGYVYGAYASWIDPKSPEPEMGTWDEAVAKLHEIIAADPRMSA